MDFSIRKVNCDEDIKRIAECAKVIWHDTFDSILKDGQVEYMIEKFQSLDALKSCVDAEGYVYYIAEADGKIAGYCGVHPETDNQKLFISKIYVHPDFQRNGIATAFFNLLKSEYGEKFKTFYLTVNKYNDRAVNVYKEWNFVTVDSVVTDIGSGYVMDDYIMEFYN